MNNFENVSGFFNSTNGNSTSSSNFTMEKIFSIGTVAHIMNSAITVLAVVFNGIIIKCLFSQRSQFPDVIFQQTLCLSVTDFIAGLTPGISCLTLIERLNRSARACTAILGIASAAHLAVLINLCFLSIRRWVVLRNATKPNARAGKVSTARIVAYIICPWLITALAFVPVVRKVISQGTTPLNGCLSPAAIEDSKTILPYFAFNIISLLLLTLFYITSMCTLKRIEAPSVNTAQSRRHSLQQKAFRHLLIVLVVSNVVTLPSVILIVLSITNIVRDSQVMFIGNRLQMLNSAVNPILYSFHIAEMKSAFADSIGQSLNSLRLCCGCNGGEEVNAQRPRTNEIHRY